MRGEIVNREYSFGRKVCARGCMHDVEDCLCGCEECQAWDSGIEDDEFIDIDEGETKMNEVELNRILSSIPVDNDMCELAFYIGQLQGKIFYYECLSTKPQNKG